MEGRKRSSARVALYGILLSALAATGCSGHSYMEVYDLPEAGWAGDQAVVFTFRPDSASVRQANGEWIDITVRHKSDFPYADLPLEIKGVAPDKRFWTDTIDFPLGALSEDGTYRWAGCSYSNHYDITRRYRSGIRYGTGGEYALSIRQLSGLDTLRGILSVGVVASGTRAAEYR